MKMDWLSEKNIDCKKTKTGMHACLDGWMDGWDGWISGASVHKSHGLFTP
jgi:hypothetical protein